MRNLLSESHLAAPSTVWAQRAGLGWKLKPVPPEQAPRAAQLLPIPVPAPGEQQEPSQDPPGSSTLWLLIARLLWHSGIAIIGFFLQTLLDPCVFGMLKTCILRLASAPKYRAAVQHNVLPHHLQHSTRLNENTKKQPPKIQT